jgi:ribonuclease HI
MTLSQNSLLDLVWWERHLSTLKAPIFVGQPDFTLFTDASKEGWGCFLPDSSIKFGGKWNSKERQDHINVLELRAVLFALKSAEKLRSLAGMHVRIMTDNSTTMLAIRNQGSVRSLPCNKVSRDIWDWAVQRNIWLSSAHVPGVDNVEADEASRKFNEDTEWQLQPRIFQNICDVFGAPKMDLFASRLNYQLKPYCAWHPDPEAAVIDSFSISWSDVFGYAFPPFALLPRILQKIRMEKADIILLVPKWPTKPWFSLFKRMIMQGPITIAVDNDTFISPGCRGKTHPLTGRLVMLAAHLSGKV